MEYLILGERIQFSEEQMNWFRIKVTFDEMGEMQRNVLEKDM